MGEVMMTVILITGGLIISAYPIIKLIGWMSDGGVEPIFAICGIFLYLCLVVSIMGAPSAGKVVILCIILISAILMPLLGKVSDDVQNKRIVDGKFNDLAAAVERDPMNAPARLELARMLRKRGELDLAIEHFEWTLQQFPRLDFRIKTELETWKREKERVGVPQNIFCHRCHAENPYNATHCVECNSAFGTRANVKQQIEREGGPQKVIRGWIVTATCLNVIVFSFIYLPHFVPIEIIGVVVISTVIVGAWLFLRWVGGDMGVVGE